jgi:hypothetical protein
MSGYRPGASLGLALLGWAAAFGLAHAQENDGALRLSLANTDALPLHCRLMFAHWVERDLGAIAPGASTSLDISQSGKGGALYILRDDGQRRMMIETILCGRDGNWMTSYGQVDLAPARSQRPNRIEAACAVPAGGGRVVCAPVRLGE